MGFRGETGGPKTHISTLISLLVVEVVIDGGDRRSTTVRIAHALLGAGLFNPNTVTLIRGWPINPAFPNSGHEF